MRTGQAGAGGTTEGTAAGAAFKGIACESQLP